MSSDANRRLIRTRAERDRYREALRKADEELLLIADDAPEDIGERIDSVRALLKDAAPFDAEPSPSAPASAPRQPAVPDTRKEPADG